MAAVPTPSLADVRMRRTVNFRKAHTSDFVAITYTYVFWGAEHKYDHENWRKSNLVCFGLVQVCLCFCRENGAHLVTNFGFVCIKLSPVRKKMEATKIGILKRSTTFVSSIFRKFLW